MIHVKRFALAWLQGAVEIFVYFPVFVALYVLFPHIYPDFAVSLAGLSVFYLLGYAFHYVFPSVWRWVGLLAAVALPGALAWLLSEHAFNVNIFLPALLAWFRGRHNRLSGWDSSFPAGLLWIGLLLYFFASFLYPRMAQTWQYAPWVTGFGIVTLALTLYRTNALTLKSEQTGMGGGERTQVSRETKWRNRSLVLTLFAIIVFIAAFRTIASAFKQAGEFLFYGAIRLYLKFLSLLGDGQSTPPPKRQLEDDLLDQSGEPSSFALIMEQVLYAIGILLTLALLIWLLVFLSKHIRRWIAQLLGWYGERLDDRGGAGYVDEKESLLDGREWTRQRTKQWKERIAGLFRKEPGWDELADNRERVRRAYLLVLLGRIAAGYKHSEARTPRETGRELNRRAPLGQEETAVLSLYEEARYSGKPITDEDAAKVKRLFDRK